MHITPRQMALQSFFYKNTLGKSIYNKQEEYTGWKYVVQRQGRAKRHNVLLWHERFPASDILTPEQ